ncbi:MAG: D-alanyl-D-alanine carboxypeptidase family protein [Ruminococcus flavefaciens]|nr:D-alanyl-D-alanine carboxypeptidase family protein [Ruminococcus flavefaciens]MCM1229693.1 D-alanyl-D-alanine carboxypeptidase family protein [Ruminococcus flavefaciens]
MKRKKKKLKLRRSAKRILVALVCISVMMFIVDSLRRDFFKKSTDQCISVEGNFISKANPPVPVNTIAFDKDSRPTDTTTIEGIQNSGFTEIIVSADKLSQGLLAIADESHPVSVSEPDKMVNLLDYESEYYTVADGVMLNEEAAEALNRLMTDYNKATDLSDFVIYGTTDTYTGGDSCCPIYFPERSAGNTVDLALLGVGSYIEFDGLDAEGWVIENCAKYGFIVRYPDGKSDKTGKGYCPWHLRYVGRLNADIMTKNNLCLEEYIDFLSNYKVDTPYIHNFNGFDYVLYSIESAGEETAVKVPIGGNYDISGDNRGTYIVSFKR